MRPKKHLEYYSRLYPDAWKQVDSMRADRGRELPFWPEWCFLPLAGTYSIVSAEAERQGLAPGRVLPPGPLVNDVGILGALAAWRVTQGVYRFDPEVFESVIHTPVRGDIPHEVFFNLPEWCVYIETPGLTHIGLPMHGFYAYLEYDANDNRRELRLVMDLHVEEEKGVPFLVQMPIHLGDWSLEESIKKAYEEAARHGGEEVKPEPMAKIIQSEFEAPISLLLYLCSANGEIGDDDKRPIKPRSVKTKKGPRLFPPDKPRMWDVGVRMGAEIRRYQRTESAYMDGHHASPRTHIRRAHWHGFWTGPRAEEQKYVLRWISPVVVNPGEDIPVTIRPVE